MFSIIFSLIACNSNSSGYKIDGHIEGVEDGLRVTMRTIKDGQPAVVDTTSLKNGNFTFLGNIEHSDIHFFNIENVPGSLPFILENKEMKFTIYKDSINLSKIEGSVQNNVAQEYMRISAKYKQQNRDLRQQFQEARANQDTAFLSSYRDKMNDFREMNRQFNIKYAKENNSSLFSVLLLENLTGSNSIAFSEANEMFNAYSKELQETPAGKRVKTKIDAVMATEVGAIAPDFTAPDPEGKEITLGAIKGKVTIIDFWAAWCGPCRRENPNVVKVYEKYHEKGLEIIGVSLDGTPKQKDAKQAWLNAIEKDGLTWHQVSNLNYFNGPVAKKYNIRSIPATFILDSEGKIIAKNVRGSALEKKISELLD